MGFYRVVVVNKSNKAGVSLFAAAETLFVVPHLHNSPDHSFGFTVGLWAIDPSEFLSDAVSLAGLNKLMAVAPSVFLSII